MKQKKFFLVVSLQDDFDSELIQGCIRMVFSVYDTKKEVVTDINLFGKSVCGVAKHVIEVCDNFTFRLVDSEYGL